MLRRIFMTAVILVIVAFTAQAQYGKYSVPKVSGSSTLTKADSISVYSYPNEVTSDKDMSFQIVYTDVSGTFNGNAIIQKSLDRSNWVPVDTLSVSDASTSDYFTVTNNALYYRLYMEKTDDVTGEGTFEFIIVGKKD